MTPNVRLWVAAAGAVSPWLVAPAVVWWRAREWRSLDDETPFADAEAPTVSVIVPARDEARNIARCVRSLLASTYARLELVVVDDHSTDGTGALARAAVGDDPRARVLDCPPLPPGWFGKQWACATGAAATSGEILLFLDADTTHGPDLVPRAVRALRARGSGLLSVIGRQELGTFWERLVQPQVLGVLLGRYGGTERVNRSARAVDKIANGQCLMVERAVYDAIGGHAAVRGAVAEDLKLAQTVFAAGYPVHLVLGERQLATRMYTSLADLVRGWRKNVYAGGREAMPGGRAGRAIFPTLLLMPPLFGIAPVLALAVALVVPAALPIVVAAALAVAVSLAFWATVYRRLGVPARYALLYPLGAVVLVVIMVQAIVRGRRVEWRGREYVSA